VPDLALPRPAAEALRELRAQFGIFRYVPGDRRKKRPFAVLLGCRDASGFGQFTSPNAATV
jgi:hypothetical protein